MILLENEKYQQICRLSLNIENPNFDDVNQSMAQNMVHCLLPVNNKKDNPIKYNKPPHGGGGSQYGGGSNICTPGGNYYKSAIISLIEDLTTIHPMLKMMSIRYLPQISNKCMKFTSNSWKMLSNRIYQMTFINHRIVDYDLSYNNKSIPHHDSGPPSGGGGGSSPPGVGQRAEAGGGLKGNTHGTRGGGGGGIHGGINQSDKNKLFQKRRTIASSVFFWGPDATDVLLDNFSLNENYSLFQPIKVYKDENRICGLDKSCGSVSNDDSWRDALEHSIERAKKMIKNRIFIHQYEKYGVDVDEMCSSIRQIESICNAYSQL
eukprot:GHVL01030795.1.p1 GENE.GHVL01030795.1~~GHVL01030795.1.p1  ORF type:complete len:320 (-),score=75.96 GHVL01030795.1:19-978(-)